MVAGLSGSAYGLACRGTRCPLGVAFAADSEWGPLVGRNRKRPHQKVASRAATLQCELKIALPQDPVGGMRLVEAHRRNAFDHRREHWLEPRGKFRGLG